MKTHLAIFDLDGTLFNTMRVNHLAYRTAMEEYGFTVSYEYFLAHCNSHPYREFLPALVGEALTEPVHERKKELYRSFLPQAVVNQPLFDLITALRPTYHTAVVTTGSRKNVLEILREFHKEDCFDCILAQEDVPRKKPDPEGFLMAMERFHVSPEQTIVFEDSEVGLEAARRSGAGVFAVKGYNE